MDEQMRTTEFLELSRFQSTFGHCAFAGRHNHPIHFSMCGIVGYVSDKKAHSLDPALASIHHRGPDAQGNQTGKLGSGQHLVWATPVCPSSIWIPGQTSPSFPKTSDTAWYSTANCTISRSSHPFLKRNEALHSKPLATLKSSSNGSWPMARIDSLSSMACSLAFMDKQEEKLLLVRDPLGIKPVYWSLKDGEFIFASEIKALWTFEGSAPEPDRSLFAEYLLNGFIYEPETGFKGVQKVFPGSWLELDTAQMKVQTTSYWKGTEHAQNSAQDLSRLVEQSIDEHTVADVPVGLFFSGGIDSTVILTAVNDRVKSMTVQSEERIQGIRDVQRP